MSERIGEDPRGETPVAKDSIFEGVKGVTELLTQQLNLIVEETYPNFPKLVVFAVEDEGGYLFDVGIEAETGGSNSDVEAVVEWAREWVRKTLE